jgi:ribosomal protein S27AE
MLQHEVVDLKNLSVSGKKFKWKRPRCPKGCKKVWVHGYVLRYFSGFKDGIYLKKYRCPTCGTVITMSPIGFWPRYQSSIKMIYEALKSRLTSYRWPSWISRQRGCHWMRKFRAFLRIEYGEYFGDIMTRLENLYVNQVPFLYK